MLQFLVHSLTFGLGNTAVGDIKKQTLNSAFAFVADYVTAILHPSDLAVGPTNAVLTGSG